MKRLCVVLALIVLVGCASLEAAVDTVGVNSEAVFCESAVNNRMRTISDLYPTRPLICPIHLDKEQESVEACKDNPSDTVLLGTFGQLGGVSGKINDCRPGEYTGEVRNHAYCSGEYNYDIPPSLDDQGVIVKEPQKGTVRIIEEWAVASLNHKTLTSHGKRMDTMDVGTLELVGVACGESLVEGRYQI